MSFVPLRYARDEKSASSKDILYRPEDDDDDDADGETHLAHAPARTRKVKHEIMDHLPRDAAAVFDDTSCDGVDADGRRSVPGR